MKQANGLEISKKLQSNTMLYVKHLLGAKTVCMEDYSELSLHNPHDHFKSHVRTNELTLLRPLSYRNQSIGLQSKSRDWFLYGNGLRDERVEIEGNNC